MKKNKNTKKIIKKKDSLKLKSNNSEGSKLPTKFGIPSIYDIRLFPKESNRLSMQLLLSSMVKKKKLFLSGGCNLLNKNLVLDFLSILCKRKHTLYNDLNLRNKSIHFLMRNANGPSQHFRWV